MTDLRIVGGTDAHGDPIEVIVIGGTITNGGEPDVVVDATDLSVIPGFIDLQVNGGWGHDFTTDPASIWAVGQRLPSTGVTSFCPTIITAPHDRVAAAQSAMAARPDDYVGAEPVGLHIEGPHLSPERRGTHPADLLLPPDESTLTSDHVAITTIAPELKGATELIQKMTSLGVVVSIGHSAASASEAAKGIDAGATLATHLFNAMPPISGRDPGIAGAVLADDRVRFGMIVDGVHLADDAVRLAWQTAPDRLILTTDAMAAAGMPDGGYEIGTIQVTVADGAVRNTDGALAGSVLTMDTGLRLLMSTTGASLAEAIPAVTATPAAALGRSDIGALVAGSRGDITLLDGDTVVATFVGGYVAFLADEDRLTGESNAAP